jgi:hypothetical protein
MLPFKVEVNGTGRMIHFGDDCNLATAAKLWLVPAVSTYKGN